MHIDMQFCGLRWRWCFIWDDAVSTYLLSLAWVIVWERLNNCCFNISSFVWPYSFSFFLYSNSCSSFSFWSSSSYILQWEALSLFPLHCPSPSLPPLAISSLSLSLSKLSMKSYPSSPGIPSLNQNNIVFSSLAKRKISPNSSSFPHCFSLYVPHNSGVSATVW